jgi:hypothetical protein
MDMISEMETRVGIGGTQSGIEELSVCHLEEEFTYFVKYFTRTDGHLTQSAGSTHAFAARGLAVSVPNDETNNNL